jgi:hypothetical protein
MKESVNGPPPIGVTSHKEGNGLMSRFLHLNADDDCYLGKA